MRALRRGQASGCSLRALIVHTVFEGVLKDAHSVEFIVETPGGTQVAPASGRTALNTDDCPTGHRIGLGTYVLPYTADEATGRYRALVYYTEEAGGEELSTVVDFEILESANPLTPLYALVSDLRGEGVPETDARCFQAIALASRQVEQFTGRIFEPTFKTKKLNGRGTGVLRVPEGICALGEIEVTGATLSQVQSASFNWSLSSVIVYNRHLTEGLTDPDDRRDPRIETPWTDRGNLLDGRHPRTVFPKGRQNVTLTGVFGTTEYSEESPVGKVPPLLRWAVLQLAVKMLPELADVEGREQNMREFAEAIAPLGSNPAAVGRFSLDPRIDQILRGYKRGPRMGAV